MPIDPNTLTPLPTGNPVPAGNRVVIKVEPLDTQGRPGKLSAPLTASSDNSPAPSVDQESPSVIWVSCDPPADLSLDSSITIGDPDGDPTASLTIDWDQSTVVEDATGLRIAAFSQPI